MRIRSVFGVDFSGAKQAGRNIWIARVDLTRVGLRLVDLSNLEHLAGSAARDIALPHLVRLIGESSDALWSMDLPMGLPIELFDTGVRWMHQLKIMNAWQGTAHEMGLWCCDQAKRLGGKMHLRRTTDTDTKTPFDGYHYRIIYQTFHGMRDVMIPLSRRRDTAILPFHYGRLRRATRVVIETCPASTLKRWAIAHQNYKQPAGGALTSRRLRTRRTIMAELSRHIETTDRHRRTIMRNPGGDALDAVIAAVGGYQAWRDARHDAIARHERYVREGYIFA
jgi:hypothetical protein